tara:strand:+ start:1402 stop:2091 length:690 start_codon:yes stop_codon:yes gene_type:complete
MKLFLRPRKTERLALSGPGISSHLRVSIAGRPSALGVVMKQATQANMAEKIFLWICAVLWHAVKAFDPYMLQLHFAGRINVKGMQANNVYKLDEKDAMEHVCRINNNRMKDGEGCVAKRGDLVKIVNTENGQFVMRYVQGSGEHRIRFNAVGIDYHAKLSLGIVNADTVDLQIVKANAADREFYLMYQDRDKSSRQSRALGWYIFLGSVLFGLVTNSIGLVTGLLKTII